MIMKFLVTLNLSQICVDSQLRDITMPSAITQNIGTAVLPAIQPQQPSLVDRQGTGVPNSSQMAQASQASSQRASMNLKAEDRNRSPNIPKRVEDPFAPQSNKRKPGRLASEETKEPSKFIDDKLDVVA